MDQRGHGVVSPEQMVDLMEIVIHQASDLPPVVLCSPLNLDKCTSGKPELADSMSWWVGDRFDVYVDALKAKELDRLSKPWTWRTSRNWKRRLAASAATRRRSRTRPPGCASENPSPFPCAKIFASVAVYPSPLGGVSPLRVDGVRCSERRGGAGLGGRHHASPTHRRRARDARSRASACKTQQKDKVRHRRRLNSPAAVALIQRKRAARAVRRSWTIDGVVIHKPQLLDQPAPQKYRERSHEATAHKTDKQHKNSSKMAYGAVADEAATLTTPMQVRSESADSIHVGFQSRRG